MKNTILLERKNKVLFAPDFAPSENNRKVIATFLKNIEPLGYTLTPEVIDALAESSDESIAGLYTETVETLRRMKGAHVAHRPMYPNFPKQVMEMEEAELYINAILYYWFGFEPVTEVVEKRPRLREKTDIQPIGRATEGEFHDIFTDLVGANSSISETDKAVVKWFVETYKDEVLCLLPVAIPSKEQVALLVNLLLTYTTLASDPTGAAQVVGGFVKTATDVLRVAVSLSGGDASLAAKPRFVTFSRQTRKLFLGLLERMKNPLEDMARWKGYWLRLGEKLHPGEFTTAFPRTAAAFQQLRNEKVRTFNGKVELALLGDVNEAIALLSERPGDFARRLNQLLSNPVVNGMSVRDAFAQAVDRVSVPVLLQLSAYFDARATMGQRLVFPKGAIAKAQVIDAPAPMTGEIPALIRADIQAALIRRFSERESMGKVYLDPALNDYLVPFSQRSASKALRTIVRGSRIKLPIQDTIRFFLYWKDGNYGSTDIDLSATMYDAKYNLISAISFHSLKTDEGCHSGDFTSAPNGANEYIDVSIKAMRNKGVRFLAMNLNVFRGQSFSELPECFAGWMGRKNPRSGEVFDPKTVKDRIDLTINARAAIPLFFDLEERVAVWCDMSDANRSYYNTAVGNAASTAQLMEGFNTMRKTTIYELISLHVAGRGELVDTPEEADVVFSETQGITPFDTEIIMAQYL